MPTGTRSSKPSRPPPLSICKAALAAGLLSGAPSTIVTLLRRENVLDSTRAAGTLLGKRSLLRGLVAHVAITLWWTAVLDRILPKRRPVVEGAAAGVAIAALDLGVIARRYPAIRDLDSVPQFLDHIAFGVVAATALAAGTD